ncbi:hypothetical protein BDD12DRAFT_864082 [Trichophaea hybrida]|nr:hypothetical protein BDD12DRAFT_864082 [Trichophaea hybrida]
MLSIALCTLIRTDRVAGTRLAGMTAVAAVKSIAVVHAVVRWMVAGTMLVAMTVVEVVMN